MTKKTKTLLIASIIIFILALIVFFILIYTSSKSNNIFESKSSTEKQEEIKKFTFIDNEGKSHTIDEFYDLGIAIVFWSSDTENSLSTLELINNYYEAYKNDIHFLIINTNEPYDDIKTLIAEFEYNFPLYFDTENLASEFYEINKLPSFVFIDKAGETHIINNGIDEDTLTANLDILAENY